MEPITAILIEDDPVIRAQVEEMLKSQDRMTLLESFDNAESGLEYLKNNPVYVVLLDIELPGMNGIDFIKNARNVEQFVVISGHRDYAADAYEFNVIDYVVKPVTMSRLNSMIHKLEKAREAVRDPDKDKAEEAGKLFVKSGTKYVPIELNDIRYIEAYSDYVQIFTKEKKITVLSTMKYMESRLPDSDFVRVHRSYIINLQCIGGVEDNSIIIDEKAVPIGRSYKENFEKNIKLL